MSKLVVAGCTVLMLAGGCGGSTESQLARTANAVCRQERHELTAAPRPKHHTSEVIVAVEWPPVGRSTKLHALLEAHAAVPAVRTVLSAVRDLEASRARLGRARQTEAQSNALFTQEAGSEREIKAGLEALGMRQCAVSRS